jgi:hypothetical protein
MWIEVYTLIHSKFVKAKCRNKYTRFYLFGCYNISEVVIIHIVVY